MRQAQRLRPGLHPGAAVARVVADAILADLATAFASPLDFGGDPSALGARISKNAWAGDGDGDGDGEKDTIFRRNDDGTTEIDRYFNGRWHTYPAGAADDNVDDEE